LPFENLDRDGAAVGGAQQPVYDLRLALLAVSVVAALGQPTAAAFDIARRYVVEHQGPALQMLLGEPGLDGALTFMQPIERGVELVFVDLAQGQLHAQARGCRGRIERLGGGELGGRRDDATDDHGHDQITRPVGLTAVPGPQQPVEANGAGRTQHGRDVSVRQRTLDRQRLLTSRDHDAALQDAAQALDMFGRPIREIEQRALADGLAVPITLSE
jgi:hypothetical protein